MMNITRGEPFTIEISFDLDMDALESFEVLVMQHGQTILRMGMEAAIIDRDGGCAFLVLSGEETASLRSGEPAYIQTLGTLISGEKLHSEVEEINLVEILGERRETSWH